MPTDHKKPYEPIYVADKYFLGSARASKTPERVVEAEAQNYKKLIFEKADFP